MVSFAFLNFACSLLMKIPVIQLIPSHRMRYEITLTIEGTRKALGTLKFPISNLTYFSNLLTQSMAA